MSGYRLSRSAQRDLVEIRNYISRHNPVGAADFIERFITRFEQLADRPLLGRSRDDLLLGLRSSLIGDHLILYRQTATDIEIARVVHGRRDMIRLF